MSNRNCFKQRRCNCASNNSCNNKKLLPSKIINAPLSPIICEGVNDGFGFVAVDSCADNVSIGTFNDYLDIFDNVSFWQEKNNKLKEIADSPVENKYATGKNLAINFKGNIIAASNTEYKIDNMCRIGAVNIYDSYGNLKSTIAQPLIDEYQENRTFGQSVSLDASGKVLLVGNINFNEGFSGNNSILYYNHKDNLWNINHIFEETSYKGQPIEYYGLNSIISQDTSTVVIPAYLNLNKPNAITLYFIYNIITLSKWELKQVLEIPGGNIADFDISRNGQYISIVGNDNHSIDLYVRNEEGNYIYEIIVKDNDVIFTAPKFSWDGKHIAFAAYSNPVYVKNTETIVNNIFSNRNRKYTGSSINEIFIYSLPRSGIATQIHKVNISLVNPTDPVYSIGLNYDATKLLAGLPYSSNVDEYLNGQVLVYDLPKPNK